VIIGIGSDMVDARRIKAALERFADRFRKRLFTAHEIAYAEGKAEAHLTYAKRFAAKEAVAKALGSGVRGFTFADIEVINDRLGKPSVTLHGGALKRLNVVVPEGHEGKIHLSLTDEDPYALAWVIIEAVPQRLASGLA
jgi:holo-[acyl-carrier protein] synthase